MKLLTFTTLYPNVIQQNHGIFVETRLRHLLSSGQVETRVVAPVPWFPFGHERFGRYAEYALVPEREARLGVDVLHPRYLVIPRIGMDLAPALLARAAKRCCERLRCEGYDFDAIDAHYFYPDGIAAVMLGRALNRPVVITARGSDINLIAAYPRPRARIQRAAREAAALICVSQALKDRLIRLGVEKEKIRVLRNGVDTVRFQPVERGTARAALRLGPGRVLASVGNLVPEKGHDLVIQAIVGLPNVQLLVVGRGPEEGSLARLAQGLGVSSRVHFLGLVPQPELAQIYSAADALVLASSREGWANVLLEAMACGTPAIATDVGAAPEIICVPEAGVLVHERASAAIAEAACRLFASSPDRIATRRYAERFGWDETTCGQIEIFRNAIDEAPVGGQIYPAASV